MIVALFAAFGVAITCVVVHLSTLRTLLKRFPPTPGAGWKIAVLVVGSVFGHLIEISLFGTLIYGLVYDGRFGSLAGNTSAGVSDYFYFSAVTFSSLGYGDITPVGHMRLVSAVESVTGIVLITWSASLTFLAMQRTWPGSKPPNTSA